MPTGRQGSIRLFRFSGIDVFLHWSWFLLAYYEINARKGDYSSIGWNVAEYLALFLIVTIHEFGHALACRQVGGQADRIVLWPFGGVAYVNPPQRPGATLWSIAAGPLVNVVLAPIIMAAGRMSLLLGWYAAVPDLHTLIHAIFYIDVGLFVFNILPIYPLDGGQILRSLLWFVLGRARSLLVATALGFLGIVAFIGLAIWTHDLWLGAIAIFLLMNCWGSSAREPCCVSQSCLGALDTPARHATPARPSATTGSAEIVAKPSIVSNPRLSARTARRDIREQGASIAEPCIRSANGRLLP
jgi:Zn-dependent protease